MGCGAEGVLSLCLGLLAPGAVLLAKKWGGRLSGARRILESGGLPAETFLTDSKECEMRRTVANIRKRKNTRMKSVKGPIADR